MSPSSPAEILNVQVGLGWKNPVINRVLTIPSDTFYIEYNTSQNKCRLCHTAETRSFSVGVLRIQGKPYVFARTALLQDGQTTYSLKQSARTVAYPDQNVIGTYLSTEQFSVFLGYTDPDVPVYADISTSTGVPEYQLVDQPTYTVAHFQIPSDFTTYLC